MAKCSGGFNGGRHNWRLDGEYDRHVTGSVALAATGRSCRWCEAAEPDFKICATVVGSGDRMMAFWRCYYRASYPSTKEPGGTLRNLAADADGLYWYCGTHAPEKRAARAAARPLTRYERDSIRYRRRDDLLTAVEAWDTDEAAVEGFCDEACEHHECRLHRAVVEYARPLPRTRVSSG